MLALVTGTFDPVTLGHMDVIEKASSAFEKVTVLVCQNFDKESTFTIEERAELIRASVSHMENVSVETHEGWLTDYLKGKVAVIVRGVRNSADLAYEENMARYHMEHTGTPTFFVFPNEEYSNISSTLVRALIESKGEWSGLIPRPAYDLALSFLDR